MRVANLPVSGSQDRMTLRHFTGLPLVCCGRSKCIKRKGAPDCEAVLFGPSKIPTIRENLRDVPSDARRKGAEIT